MDAVSFMVSSDPNLCEGLALSDRERQRTRSTWRGGSKSTRETARILSFSTQRLAEAAVSKIIIVLFPCRYFYGGGAGRADLHRSSRIDRHRRRSGPQARRMQDLAGEAKTKPFRCRKAAARASTALRRP